MSAEMSKLVPYSLGIVAANKELSSKEIEVTPIEAFNMLDGEITDNGSKYDAKGKDANDKDYSVSVPTSTSIKATWMPISDSNRFTAPDVRRGELVQIYQYADADKYYWTTIKDDLTLRKLETVIYAFSGTKDESDKVGNETHYFLEISTHRKLIHFHTSKANEEPFSYDIQINTGQGFIAFQDDNGNYFSIDSKNRRIELNNTDNTNLDMDRKNFTVTVPGDTTINTTGDTKINTDGNTDITSKGNMNITSVGAMNIASTGGSTTIRSTGTIHAQTGQIILDGVDNGGANVTVLGLLTATQINTPNEITCPSISGVASGLKS